MISLVWAAVVLVLGVLAYRAVLEVAGRKMATKEDVAELEKTWRREASDFVTTTNTALDSHRKTLAVVNDSLSTLADRLDVLDQRTDPQATGQVTPTGRPPRRVL